MPDAVFTIRTATAADIPILVEARRHMFEDLGDPVDAPGYDQVDAGMAEFLGKRSDDPLPFGYVAEDDAGGWLGALAVSHETVPPSRGNPTGRQSYLYGLWVRPEHRRRGIARALVTTAIEGSRAAGEGAVWLYASDHGRALYESLGMHPGPAMRLFFDPLHGPDGSTDE